MHHLLNSLRPHQMMVREVLNSALDEEMLDDPKVFVMGEEVGEYQGACKVSNIFSKTLNAGWICRNRSWCSIS